VAYMMVAERENQSFKKERASALIVLANARVWESEGWRVMITDGDGKEFNPAAFEELLGPGFSWSPQEPLALAPSYYEDVALSSQQETPAEETEPADPALAREPITQAAGFEEADAFAEADGFEETDEFEEAGRFEEREPFVETEPFAETEPFENDSEPFREVTTFEELEASYERLVAHR
jgi:hypothetical protein